MATVEDARIAALLEGAGFKRGELVTGVAVALAESGGDPGARCKDCVQGVAEDSRGLWQINVNAHPWGKSIDLYDPATNAKAARRVYLERNGGSWRPWSTYLRGDHKQFLDRARQAVATHLDGSPTVGIGDPADRKFAKGGSSGGGEDDPDLLDVARDPVGSAVRHLVPDRATWLRIGQGAAGATLLVAAGVVLFRDAAGEVGGTLVGGVVDDVAGNALEGIT